VRERETKRERQMGGGGERRCERVGEICVLLPLCHLTEDVPFDCQKHVLSD